MNIFGAADAKQKKIVATKAFIEQINFLEKNRIKKMKFNLAAESSPYITRMAKHPHMNRYIVRCSCVYVAFCITSVVAHVHHFVNIASL